MEENRLFIGNIRRCTKYEIHKTFGMDMYIGTQCISSDSGGHIEREDELYKENAILLKTKDGFVDCDIINNIDTIAKAIKRNCYLKNIIMPTYPTHQNSLFVDEKSLRPYESIVNKVPKIIEKAIK